MVLGPNAGDVQTEVAAAVLPTGDLDQPCQDMWQ